MATFITSGSWLKGISAKRRAEVEEEEGPALLLPKGEGEGSELGGAWPRPELSASEERIVGGGRMVVRVVLAVIVIAVMAVGMLVFQWCVLYGESGR